MSAGLLLLGVLGVPVSAAAAEVALSPESRASELAKARGVPVTVPESVTESQSVVANPDGSFTAEIHGGPTRFRNGQGDWVDVDLNLYRRPDGSIAPKAHPRGLVLAGKGTGSRDLARFVSKGHEIAVGWEGVLPEPSLSGTKATYADAMPGVDLVVESTRLGFEYFLVVKNRGAASRVAQVRMPWRAEGLAAEHTGEGAVKLRDKSNAVVAWAPAAQMWDARVSPRSGDPLVQAKVGVTVEKPSARRSAVEGATAGASMRVVPDAKFLADPKTVYPVTIDPTVTEYADFDTFTQNSYTSDQSGANLLKLGYVVEGGKAYYARSHLRFNSLSGYAGANVLSATLYLYNIHSFSCRPNYWQVWRTDPVTSAVRWTSPPKRQKFNGESDLTKGYSGCGAGWVTNTVTESFQTAFNSGSSSNSLEIAAKSTASQDSWKKFDSMETANDPYVSLNYNRPPAAPTGLTIGGKACATGASRPTIASTVTPIQLTANVSDPDSAAEAVSLNARFFVAELGSALPATPTVTSPTVTQPKSGGAQTATASLPAGFVLQEFHTYYFQVKGWDQENEGAWSAICEFYVDNGSPAKAPLVTALDTLPGTSTKIYPEDGTGGGPGVSSTFRFTANGETDISKYRYKYSYRGVTTNWVEVPTPTPGASVEVELAPPFDDGDGSDTLASLNMGGQWAITVEMADSANPPRWSTKSKLYLTNVASAPAALAHWKMNEPANYTQLADQTTDFNAIMNTMTKSADGFGDFGTSWTFNGTTSYAAPVNTPIDTTRSFSVAAWVKLTDKSTDRVVAAKLSSGASPSMLIKYHIGNDRWQLLMPNGSDPNASGFSWQGLSSVAVPSLGAWTHLVGTFDGATATSRLYVNGQLEASRSDVVAFNQIGGEFRIGRSNGNSWAGDIDEVAVWQRTLDPREIGALAVAERASWDLDHSLMDTVGKPVSTMPFDLRGFAGEALDIGVPQSDDPLWWGTGHPIMVGQAEAEDGGAALLNWDPAVEVPLSLFADRPVLRTDQSFSVSVWVNPHRIGGDNMYAVGQDGTDVSGLYLGTRDVGGSTYWAFALKDTDLATSTTRFTKSVNPLSSGDIGTWDHLVGTYDAGSGRIKLYVNGVLQGATMRESAPGVRVQPWQAGGVFSVGRGLYGGAQTNHFSGGIDEIRVFQGVLTQDMVGRLYRTSNGEL
ncbi:hypothetical protein CS0771_32550 [Catellatospora sp. IY07-71]|uniref:LamG-like jellyroll fold domain-containing protein n=1 Tax=Catellatospora sp. IY07-71 TaxID=2728827 RepID=UPI001BB33E8A|nr:LamG-like jellyroll fold domain-containing protein [Catellatospora sp. IY07-71]BCJ73711.1 hypothetical protein CS0771_32550 [Catellatospora sp. IY07-71]